MQVPGQVGLNFPSEPTASNLYGLTPFNAEVIETRSTATNFESAFFGVSCGLGFVAISGTGGAPDPAGKF